MVFSVVPGGAGQFAPDARLARQLGKAGPRYACYPSAERFSAEFGYRDYLQAVAGLRTRGSARALSLYLHIPFCEAACHHCACHKVSAKGRDKAATYLSYLKREIEMQGRLFGGMNQLEQLHLGGGDPSYLSDAQLGELMQHTRRWFQFAPDLLGEYSIDLDPRGLTPKRIDSLRQQGFNRISLGLHDDDPGVERALNRMPGSGATEAAIGAARAAGFRSVGVKLLYGLPQQTPDSMAHTLARLVAAGPDRILLAPYVHRPLQFKAQRLLDASALPGPELNAELLALCSGQLLEAGYLQIGMGQFARPGDELAVAQRQGRLRWNFQGYSGHAGADLVACGLAAVSAVGATYCQNVRTLDAYYELLDRNELPIARGLRLDMDDLLRRTLIQTLLCHFELSVSAIEQAFPIVFASYFGPELECLRECELAGLLSIGADFISVSPKGRKQIRALCMVFDRYLACAPSAATRSKAS
ncbi:MAG: oxygen-independent coproporphyrinogen III oxidase [Pseudomonadota bacterium]